MNETYHSELKDIAYIVGFIAIIIGLFVVSNVVIAIKAYQAGDANGRQYVISSVELQKCGILKKNFQKGHNEKENN